MEIRHIRTSRSTYELREPWNGSLSSGLEILSTRLEELVTSQSTKNTERGDVPWAFILTTTSEQIVDEVNALTERVWYLQAYMQKLPSELAEQAGSLMNTLGLQDLEDGRAGLGLNILSVINEFSGAETEESKSPAALAEALASAEFDDSGSDEDSETNQQEEQDEEEAEPDLSDPTVFARIMAEQRRKANAIFFEDLAGIPDTVNLMDLVDLIALCDFMLDSNYRVIYAWSDFRDAAREVFKALRGYLYRVERLLMALKGFTEHEAHMAEID